jgi:predicted nucleic acid-binding protein
MQGKPDHLLEDVMIAATARVYALKLPTGNERDFGLLGIGIVNPFKSGA